MPRIALISDIHGNLEALDAVMADLARVDLDVTVCLGDVVGYGPDPAACVDAVLNACDVVLLGNHEEALLTGPNERFNDNARASSEFTRTRLDAARLAAIRSWPTRAEVFGVALAHATFAAQRYEYLYTVPAAERSFRAEPAEFSAVGHTHVPSAFSFEAAPGSGAPATGAAPQGAPVVKAYQLSGSALVGLPRGARYILNPGSVGQPRDRNPDAAWAVLDTDARTIEVRRVAYDAQAVRHKIRRAGLPERLGERLLLGA